MVMEDGVGCWSAHAGHQHIGLRPPPAQEVMLQPLTFVAHHLNRLPRMTLHSPCICCVSFSLHILAARLDVSQACLSDKESTGIQAQSCSAAFKSIELVPSVLNGSEVRHICAKRFVQSAWPQAFCCWASRPRRRCRPKANSRSLATTHRRSSAPNRNTVWAVPGSASCAAPLPP